MRRKQWNNRGQFFILAVVILGALGLGGLLYSVLPVGSVVNSGDYIQAPYYGTVSCAALPGGDLSFTNDLSSNGQWLDLPTNTKSWTITLHKNTNSVLTTYGFEYYVCPQKNIISNCEHFDWLAGASSDQSDKSFTVSSKKFVWAQKQSQGINTLFKRSGSSGGTYEVSYTAYGLLRTDATRGGQQYLNPADSTAGCTVPYSDVSWENRILSASGVSGLTTATSRDLQPEEKFNYISGTITKLAAGNVQTYKGSSAYCVYANGQANLYPISQVQTPQATYNIVDTQGASIGTEICCPGDNLPDKTCGSNFQWIATANSQCSITNPCEGTEWRADLTNTKQAIKYACVSGSCQAQTKAVECTVSSQCGTNQYCDPNSFTCVNGQVGGTGSIPGLDIAKNGWPWWVWGIVIVVGGFIFFKYLWPYVWRFLVGLRSFLKGVPYIGNFIP